MSRAYPLIWFLGVGFGVLFGIVHEVTYIDEAEYNEDDKAYYVKCSQVNGPMA